jgi:hypothetical protein
MDPTGTLSLLERTRDHVVPKRLRSSGYPPTPNKWCCYQCNQIKGGMPPEQWDLYTICKPRWWLRPENQIRRKHRICPWKWSPYDNQVES